MKIYFTKNIHTIAVFICTLIMKCLVREIQLADRDFLSISNQIFAGYTGSKSLVRNRQKIPVRQLDFSNQTFQNQSADEHREKKSIGRGGRCAFEITFPRKEDRGTCSVFTIGEIFCNNTLKEVVRSRINYLPLQAQVSLPHLKVFPRGNIQQ